MGTDNALSFVGQIMTVYKAVMKAEGGALQHAIECGKYLALAKENVEAAKPKRKWSAWLSEHCPDIHRNTAALYMRLADNAEEIADCTSIREADMKLRQPSRCGDGDSDESDAQRVVQEDEDGEISADTKAALLLQSRTSPDLVALLQNTAVDEVCTALIDAWDEDHIRQLCDRLRDHFQPPANRRPLVQPTLS
jgi:hypothetical protein